MVVLLNILTAIAYKPDISIPVLWEDAAPFLARNTIRGKRERMNILYQEIIWITPHQGEVMHVSRQNLPVAWYTVIWKLQPACQFTLGHYPSSLQSPCSRGNVTLETTPNDTVIIYHHDTWHPSWDFTNESHMSPENLSTPSTYHKAGTDSHYVITLLQKVQFKQGNIKA